MVEDLDRSRGDNVGKAPWLKIFMGFKLALDPKKLLLAALGIFIAYFGWWVISSAFYGMRSIPAAKEYNDLTEKDKKEAFLDSALSWSLLHIMAGHPVADDTIKEWQKVQDKLVEEGQPANPKITTLLDAMEKYSYGLLRQCPWNEDRGPNQLVVVANIIQKGESGLTTNGLSRYAQFSVEPLIKFLLPVTYFFDGRAGGMLSFNRIYLVFILFWMIATWGIFGGAITRIACVQLARNEKVGLGEALQFVAARWQGYVFAPALPLGALLGFSLCLWFFGLCFGITFFLGDLIAGIIWPITMITGLIMAVVMVGLLGWPLMNATISTEGSDSFDALSRSYSYVYQVPWHCLGYTLLSLVYGAVVIFFVGFMGSLVVYLGNWGVERAYFIDSRDPAFLSIYAPKSFHWRDVMLMDSPHAQKDDTGHYAIPDETLKKMEWYQHWSVGSYLVTFWLGLFFLFIIGFGYSFFWSAATIIYLLLRQQVDDTDLDEVFLEEEEEKPFMSETPAAPAATAAPTPNNAPPAVKFTMVDATSIRAGEPGATPSSPGDSPPAAAPSPDSGTAPPGM